MMGDGEAVTTAAGPATLSSSPGWKEPAAAPEGLEFVAPATTQNAAYAVHLAGCPRRRVETGLPPGPQAEKVAADKYMAWLRLVRRPGLEPVVGPVES